MLKKSLFVLVVTFIIALIFSTGQTQVPQLINYQGMLTDAGGTALSGSFVIEFKIYDAATAGNVLWTETQTVTVTAGLFDVLLGSVTPIPYTVFDGSDKYLSLKVGTDPEMTPRKRLVSVGYAFRAYNADKVDGLDAAAFVQAGQANAIATAMIQDNAVTAAKIAPNVVSSVNGVSNDGGNIDLVAGSNVTITPDDANNTIIIAATPGSGGIGGSGTTNYVPKFTAATSIGNSAIYEDNSRIGIGTNSPDAPLKIVGDTRIIQKDQLFVFDTFDNNDAYGGIRFGIAQNAERAAIRGYGDYSLRFLVRDNTDYLLKNRLTIKTNGNVGIGTSTPATLLDVDALRNTYSEDYTLAKFTHRIPTGRTVDFHINYYGNTIGDGTLAFHENRAEKDFLIVNLLSQNNKVCFPNGNIGIGTIAPTQKLDIAGTAQMTGFKLPTSAANNYVLTSDANGVGTWKAIPATPDNDWTISANDMYSAVSGNVGIGVTTPSDKLSVEGNISARNKVIVKGSFYPTRTLTMESVSSQSLTATNDFYITYGTEVGTGGLVFTEGQNQRMRIHTGGNVGIGINFPTQKLDIAGTAQMTGFKMPTGAANNYVLTSDASGVGTWKAIPATPDNDWTMSGNNMYAAVSGNVGIGINNPAGKLDVSHNGSSHAFVVDTYGRVGIGEIEPVIGNSQLYVSTTSSGVEGGLFYLNNTSNAQSALRCLTNGTGDAFKVQHTGASGNIARFESGGQARMVVGVNGNVGIGTTNPSNKFHVVAQDAVGLFESTGNLAYLRLYTKEGINNRVELKNNAGGMLSLWTAGTGAGDVLNITRDGKVGIGTTSPGVKLQVEGTTQITATGDDTPILWLNCERPYAFRQRGTEGTAGLDLRPNVDGKLISISAADKNILGGFFDRGGTSSDYVYFVPDGGSVGVGIAYPSRIFEIKQGAGHAIADGWDVYSSRRWKTNVQPITGALAKITHLTGVAFDWKENGKHDLGLIAEDVGQVIPEVVSYEANGIDAQSVDYARLVALLIQGIKEQQSTIDQLTRRIDELEKKNR